MSSKSNYRLLIDKLDEFIRKYYLNKLVRGAIIMAALLLSLSLLFISIEYFFYLPAALKTALVLVFALISLASLVYWLLLPISAYFKLGKSIDHATAADIIGRHFPDVGDRLLNTLQLHNSLENEGQRELVLAGIDQKIENLKPISFKAAIKIYENKRFAKYVLLPFALIVLLAFTAPALLKDGSYRMVNYQQNFEKPAPFSFHLQNKQLKAVQNDDFTLNLKMEGKEIPASVYLIDENGHRFKMGKNSILEFTYSFKNLQQSRSFRFYGNGFYSERYTLKVLPKPTVIAISIELNYPPYLNKTAETINNIGELKVPAGTEIQWNFITQNTERLQFSIYGKAQNLTNRGKGTFRVGQRVVKPTTYSIKPINNVVKTWDSLSYNISIIPDDYPKISVETKADSLSGKRFYHIGKISDDHGFSKLGLVVLSPQNGGEVKKYVPIAISSEKNSQYFFYSLNINKLGIENGEKVQYYFEVFDNDAVSGPKSARSRLQSLYQPTFTENAAQLSENNENISKNLKEAANRARQIQQEAQRLNQLLIQQKQLGFDDKKQVLDLVDQQEKLETFLEKIRQENKKNSLSQNSETPDVEKKQEQFDKLLKEIIDPETRKILEELKKLIKANTKNTVREKLNSMQMDNNAMEKELERLLELYKQLKFDEQLQQNIQQLEKMAENQQKMAERTEKTHNENKNTLQNEQKSINKSFNELTERLKSLGKQEKELNNSSTIEQSEELQKSIKQQQSQSMGQLAKGKPAKAATNQKEAAAKMQRLSAQLQQKQRQSASMQLNVNLRALRQILDNLVHVSFNQETLMLEMKQSQAGSDAFNGLIKSQLNIKNELQMVQDSIYSLSKKIPQLSSFVNREAEKINNSLKSILDNISNKRPNEIAMQQQTILTSVNNLAVMLSELQQQLQKMMDQAKQKGQGGNLGQLAKIQQSLNEKLGKAKKGLKPGERVPASKSEQMARMAKEQESIRNSLQKIARELSKNGSNPGLDKAIGDMEKTVTELYNKKLTAEMLLRQKEIASRLLQAETAEKEQDLSKEREAQQAEQFTADYKQSLNEFKAKQEKQLEMLNTVPIDISLFYREKISEYFNYINKKN